MKNYTNWLIAALLFACLQTSNAQAIVGNSLSDILTDTLGNRLNHPTNIGKSLILDLEKDWESVFRHEKVKQNAFRIDTTIDMRPQPKPQRVELSLANRDIPPSAGLIPSETFDFAKAKMTVKMVSGQFIESPQTDSIKRVWKGIVENTFKIDVDEDNAITDFFSSNTFVHNGEIYHRVTDEELESEEYKKPRVKKTKPILTNEKFVHSPAPTSNEDFIDDYEDAALDGERYGVPYAITMAQGILESRGGRSHMAVTLNNLFGIKDKGGRCTKEGCPHGYFDDDRQDETFVRYTSYGASFKAHVNFFLNNNRYQKCLSCGTDNITCWLYRLQRSGYATDRMYDYKLASIINRYKLTKSLIRYNRKEVAQQLK